MYGYIRPDIGELRINEYRRFRSAYCGLCEALLPESAWTPIIENILSRGVPHVADAVFAGTWKKNRKNTEDL